MGQYCYEGCSPCGTGGSIDVTGINLGAGIPLLTVPVNNNNIELKSLVAGTNITLNDNGNEVTINATSGTTVTVENLGAAEPLLIEPIVGNNVQAKSLQAGTNITFDTLSNPDEIIINATDTDTTYTASSVGGTGIEVYAGAVGTDFQFKRLVPGANMSISESGGEITFTASGSGGGGEINHGQTLGTGEPVYAGLSGTDLTFKSLIAGTNITLTATANDITIDATDTGETNDGNNVGTGNGVYKDKTGSTLNFRSLIAGTGINIAQNLDDLTLSTNAEQNTASNLGAGSEVFAQKTGVDFEFRTLVPGTGVSLVQNTDTIEISATGSGEVNDGSNLGAGSEVFAQKTGLNLEFRTLVAGAGISLTQNTDSIDIVNSDPNVDQNLYETVTGDTGTATASSVTDTLEIVGGTNVTTDVTQSGSTTTVTINSSGGGSSSFDGPYRFDIQLNAFGAVDSAAGVSNVTPSGWVTASSIVGNDVSITHNVGAEPRVQVFKTVNPDNSVYVNHDIATTSTRLSLNTTSLTTDFTLENVIGNLPNSQANATITVELHFAT